MTLRPLVWETEKLFQEMFMQHSAVMLIVDPDTGEILKANKAAEKVYGYDFSAEVPVKIFDINPMSQAEMLEETERAKKREQNVFFFTHRLKNGKIRQVEVHSTPVRYGEKKLLFSIIHDITDKRTAEKRLELAFMGNKDGLWDWNPQTNEVFFSPRWKEMLGYSDDEIKNNLAEWGKRVHPDDLHDVMKDLNKHLAGESESYENIHRVKCKDGSYKYILDRGKVVERNDEGKPVRVVGTHTDIDQRKKVELENERLVVKLKAALDKVKTLSGLIPICSKCKNIRDDKGYWSQIETFLKEHSNVEFSHGICPKCVKELYPEMDL